jgi:catechol 2,3-dioxygenase
MNEAQTTSILPATTSLGVVTLGVSNLARSVDFYTRVIGFKVLSPATDTEATLGVGSTALLHLVTVPNAKRQPSFSTGLYHVAILLPSRADLGRFLLNLIKNQSPTQRIGSADHLVSEAIYLNDPDGNGLEVYRDRPRSEWQWEGSMVKMDTVALDADGIIAAVPDPNAPFPGAPEGTVIGHIHLRVGNIEQARVFYTQVVGFDVVADMQHALFVSAGGYHHHIGMNIWQSEGAPRASEDSVGLREYTITIPSPDALSALAARLTQAGYPVNGRDDSSFLSHDPWGNVIRFTAA